MRIKILFVALGIILCQLSYAVVSASNTLKNTTKEMAENCLYQYGFDITFKDKKNKKNKVFIKNIYVGSMAQRVGLRLEMKY